MSNKPIAWMRTNKQWRKEVSFVEKEGFDIPLYTHPVELTDEELDSIIASVPYPRTHAMDKHMIKLALKKASEK